MAQTDTNRDWNANKFFFKRKQNISSRQHLPSLQELSKLESYDHRDNREDYNHRRRMRDPSMDGKSFEWQKRLDKPHGDRIQYQYADSESEYSTDTKPTVTAPKLGLGNIVDSPTKPILFLILVLILTCMIDI